VLQQPAGHDSLLFLQAHSAPPLLSWVVRRPEGLLMAKLKDGHELGSPPGSPLPDGVFPVKSGPPVQHPMTAEILKRGPECLYRYCQDRGMNEQTTYSYLRSFFRLNFKAFKALSRRVDRAEQAAAPGGRE
jgi:hypothetical protein